MKLATQSESGVAVCVWGLNSNISEAMHDTELVSMEDLHVYETTQALSVGEVNFDTAWPWKVKDRFDLVRSASALAQFLLLCPSLAYSAVMWGHHENVEGHSK